MIEIPEEGLRIWICGVTSECSRLEPLTINPKECADLDGNNCTYRVMNGKPCDAQAYRIMREKP